MENTLRQLYFDAKKPGSYTGLSTFKRSVPKSLRKKAESWLRDQDVYNLHRPVQRKFRRTKIITSGIDQQFQADLVDLTKISSYNDGYKFLLTVIDCFSRYAWTRMLKNKKSSTVSAALEDIFTEGRVPDYLQTDQGMEFRNKQVQDLLKRYGIKYFTSYNDDIKAGLVERFNRTILSKIHRYFTKHNTRSYSEKIQDFVHSYNNTVHSAHGLRPSDVTSETQEKVWLKLYNKPFTSKLPQFKIGDHVRVSKSRKTFDKGYLPRWSTELFVVKKVKNTVPVTYEIADLDDEVIAGVFYDQELIKAKPPEFYEIEKVLDKKSTKRGGVQYLVKWKGYPNKFNSWTSDLIPI